MKIISLFSGIGAFEKALTNLNIKPEIVGFSEIDKYAIKSYCAIHNVSEDKNLGDITKIEVDKLPQDIDLITHGSPCQDFSIAGKQQGAEVGSGTRSSLMWNTVEIVKHCRPKCIIWENVKNLLSAKHRHNFDAYLQEMESLGYTNYYQVLNAKDYGIPQNRERVFTISILGEHNTFDFPQKQELKLKFKDFVDNDEKWLIPQHILNSFNNKGGDFGKRFKTNNLEYSMCITTKPSWAVITNNFYTNDLKKYNIKEIVENNKKVFANSPKMCWTLMGFDNTDFEKAKATGNSNSQLYKQAGNSIVVDVLEKIFLNLLEE